ncbi:MAG: response regulator [Pseudomonadota bacterium]
MATEPRSFEEAITAKDFSSEDYCGTSYAAKLLGLSVATVQSLVEKGEIEAWKTLGGHRRISLQALNIYRAKNNPQIPKIDVDPKNRLRVLLVEDDEDTRELYKCQFEEWNLPVDCTWMPSAIEALMDIASMRPDLLITDLSMPGVDGIEMLKALKRNQQLADMHIVVISGLPIEAIEARGGLPPHSQLLQKPVNFDWLQGYLTALVSVNVKWRGGAPPSSRRAALEQTASSAISMNKPARDEAGAQNVMA